MVTRALGQHEILWMKGIYAIGEALNMPYIALNLSHYVNGVARKHGEVSRLMYAVSDIDSITNGVHAVTWTSKPFQELFDRYTPAWRENNFSLRHALNIPRQAIWDAHVIAKSQLFEIVKQQTGAEMDPMVLTLGFARRITGYKRPALLLQDIPRLKDISSRVGRLQVIYAGKAHPRDDGGKQIIQRITRAQQELGDVVRLVFSAQLQCGTGSRSLSGSGRLAQHTRTPAGGIGDQRHEGRAGTASRRSASSTAGGSKAASKASPAGRSAMTRALPAPRRTFPRTPACCTRNSKKSWSPHFIRTAHGS